MKALRWSVVVSALVSALAASTVAIHVQQRHPATRSTSAFQTCRRANAHAPPRSAPAKSSPLVTDGTALSVYRPSTRNGRQRRQLHDAVAKSLDKPHKQTTTTAESSNDKASSSMAQLESILDAMPLDPSVRSAIPSNLQSAGFATSSELLLLASDFINRPEGLSRVLQDDFGFGVYEAHICRAALLNLVRMEKGGGTMEGENAGGRGVGSAEDCVGEEGQTMAVNGSLGGENDASEHGSRVTLLGGGSANGMAEPKVDGILTDTINGAGNVCTNSQQDSKEAQEKKRPLFKAVVVNPKAKERHTTKTIKKWDTKDGEGTKKETTSGHQYSLPSNYAALYPALAADLRDFMVYMTRPSASSQEPPIREATARVYQKHAGLFLGWYLREGESTDVLDMESIRGAMECGEEATDSPSQCCQQFNLGNVIPTKDASSAQPVVDFILWLRNARRISDSYEANVLRGLTKLLKFRFASVSTADPTYGEKSFHDIPAVRELRKLHRDANQRQAKSPRSSDEDLKWISWEEYLGVVEGLKRDVMEELEAYEKEGVESVNDGGGKRKTKKGSKTNAAVVGRRIATKYQRYLVLAFFSCIPDRQRTVRELELGRTFLRNDADGTWTVRHGPDDYKTGGTYGDRPPLVLSPDLTPSIDDFLEGWRPYLNPTGQHVFVQPRTGKPLTRDSVYGIVARSCYERTGKKTNPHLLRDMIVTHVRESSDATERDLEALALFMGHSVAMQRTSYDRRTIAQKVAPAVELLKSVNKGKGGG